MTLRTYVIRRLLVVIPTIILITIITFTLIHLVPGGPFKYFEIANPLIKKETIEMIRHQIGLDKPIWMQYLIWLKDLLTGKLGYSYVNGAPISSLLKGKIMNTLKLMLISQLLSVFIAIPLGVMSAVKRYSIIDNMVMVTAISGVSLPRFWFAIIAIFLFSHVLGWLPTHGLVTAGAVYTSSFDSLIDQLRHLILPMSVMVFGGIAFTTRLVRTTMLEVLSADYIRTARAKGLKESVVVYKHALRNALLPVVTIVGLNFGFMLSGSVITETVFAWPGMGRLMVDSAFRRDYPTIMTIILIVSLLVLFANLITDISYSILDPRIRY